MRPMLDKRNSRISEILKLNESIDIQSNNQIGLKDNEKNSSIFSFKHLHEKNENLGIHLLRSITARIIQFAIGGYVYCALFCIKREYKYLAFIIPILLIPMEVIYIYFQRKGREFKWYTFFNLFFKS